MSMGGASGSSGSGFSRKGRQLRSKQTVRSVAPDVNVTPLIDVVLVLLIIFMVVTPMLARGVAVDLPRTRHHDKKSDTGEQIIVTIRSDGKVFLDKQPMENMDRLSVGLAELLRRSPGRDVYIKGDYRIKYKVAREVLEAVHRGGAVNAALGTDEEK
jgi:biopolymer transport protein ExbD